MALRYFKTAAGKLLKRANGLYMRALACCCRGVPGVFDWCGPGVQTIAPTDLFYRTPSVLPAGKGASYSSIDDGWWVDYSPDAAADVGVIYCTIAPFLTAYCWAIRSGNYDHPQGNFPTNLLPPLPDWTEGADADYDDDGKQFKVTTADPTTEATLTTTLTLNDADPGPGPWPHLLTLHTKFIEAVSNLRVEITNINGGTSLVQIINIEGGGMDVGDGQRFYEIHFDVENPAGPNDVIVGLSSAGAVYDGEVGDWVGLIAVTLRRDTGETPGYDIALVDMSDQEILVHHYVSKILSINATMPVDWGTGYPSIEDQIAGITPDFSAGVPQNEGLGEAWDDGYSIAWGDGHACPATVFAGSEGIGFMIGGGRHFAVSNTGAMTHWCGGR